MSRPGADPPGRLLENAMHFARALRAAGLPLGPGQIIEGVRALQRVDLTRRDEFYWALHAVFVTDHRQHALFDEAFRLFWRDPAGLDEILKMMLPTIRAPYEQRPTATRRVDEALRGPPRPARGRAAHETPERVELDATLTYSDRETLRSKDFEQMSAEEVRQARRLIAELRWSAAEAVSRRFQPDARGARVDARAMLRASIASGGNSIPMRYRTPKRRPRPLVALCDVSGSMERYSRMLLQLMHGLVNAGERRDVHCFVFGTRLTNITRHLRHRDVDLALARAGRAVQDWAGGTRIGACLREFNRQWARRVLGQGAVVLLVTDGLDREGAVDIAAQMDRLHHSCRHLVWLNPLLRFDGFEPRAEGIVAMLPHVDEFRSAHNVHSLAELVQSLSRDLGDRRRRAQRTQPANPKSRAVAAATRAPV